MGDHGIEVIQGCPGRLLRKDRGPSAGRSIFALFAGFARTKYPSVSRSGCHLPICACGKNGKDRASVFLHRRNLHNGRFAFTKGTCRHVLSPRPDRTQSHRLRPRAPGGVPRCARRDRLGAVGLGQCRGLAPDCLSRAARFSRLPPRVGCGLARGAGAGGGGAGVQGARGMGRGGGLSRRGGLHSAALFGPAAAGAPRAARQAVRRCRGRAVRRRVRRDAGALCRGRGPTGARP